MVAWMRPADTSSRTRTGRLIPILRDADSARVPYMMRMDIVRIPGSRIVEISRIAFATPDVDFLCFGESDQPSPASAHAAAVAALDAGATRYTDVRGLPELRTALA